MAAVPSGARLRRLTGLLLGSALAALLPAVAAAGPPAGLVVPRATPGAPLVEGCALEARPAMLTPLSDTEVRFVLRLLHPPPPGPGSLELRFAFGDGGHAELPLPANPATTSHVYPAGISGYVARARVVRRDAAGAGQTLARCTLGLGLATAPGTVPAAAVPPPPRDPGAFRFAVISDTNGPYGATRQGEGVAAAMRALTADLRVDFVVHNGDMVGGQRASLSAEQVAAMWAGYDAAIANPLRAAQLPLVPVAGNHDAAPAAALPDRSLYVRHWTPPSAWLRKRLLGPATGYPLAYAFRHAESCFLVLDVPTGRLRPEDLPALDQSLAACRRAPHTFVFAHVPPQRFSERDYGRLQPWNALAERLRRHRVTALFAGHYEVYYDGLFDGVPLVLTGTLAAACQPRRDVPSGCRCRTLAGWPYCQGLSFVLVDVGPAGARWFAVQGPEFRHVLPIEALPPTVLGCQRRSR